MAEALKACLESDYIPSDEIHAAYGTYKEPDDDKAR
jgi:hypothetical protein